MNNSALNLTLLLKDISTSSSLSNKDWMEIIALGRQLGLLANLYVLLEEYELLAALPQNTLSHLRSAFLEVSRQQSSIRWHLEKLVKTNPGNLNSVLLKGAAYIYKNKRNARGRVLSDIDLLVMKSELDNAEFWLFINGFVNSVSDEYDDFYYRQWMHELPPFVSMDGDLVLDLHHNILPITSERHIDASKIFEKAELVLPNILVPCDEDLIVHSAVHLLQDSIFDRTLRDLYDLYCLMEDLSDLSKSELLVLKRSEELNLASDLSKVILLMKEVFARDLSFEENAFVEQHLTNNILWYIEKKCYVTMLYQPVLSDWRLRHSLASFCIFIKSHWIKMPLRLLFKHSLIKSYKRTKNFLLNKDVEA